MANRKETSMKKILLALVAVLVTTGAFAQTAATANIPFEFRVGETLMPAGTYKVAQRWAGEFVLLTNTDQAKNAGILTTPLGPAKNTEPPRLVFHRYGSVYFLAQVWTPNTEYGRKIKTGAAERETARGAFAELASVRIQ
jgi:hypothetical protein